MRLHAENGPQEDQRPVDFPTTVNLHQNCCNFLKSYETRNITHAATANIHAATTNIHAATTNIHAATANTHAATINTHAATANFHTATTS